jgi:hypothetical protein
VLIGAGQILNFQGIQTYVIGKWTFNVLVLLFMLMLAFQKDAFPMYAARYCKRFGIWLTYAQYHIFRQCSRSSILPSVGVSSIVLAIHDPISFQVFCRFWLPDVCASNV